MLKIILKIVMAVSLLGFCLLTLVPSPRKSVAGRILRFCAGEPGATQGVNDAADIILSKKWEKNLELFADQTINEFKARKDKLPPAFMEGYLPPSDRLPARYRELGNIIFLGLEPELVMRQSEASTSSQIIIDWAHMRHAVTPKHGPEGFHARKANEHIYVVAGES